MLFRSKVDHLDNFQSTRIYRNGTVTIQPQICPIYIGYYDGPIKFSDGESSGIEVFFLDELKDDLKNNPDKYTNDIHFMIKKYSKYLKPIKK